MDEYRDSCFNTSAFHQAKTWEEYNRDCDALIIKWQEVEREIKILDGVPEDELPLVEYELLDKVYP